MRDGFKAMVVREKLAKNIRKELKRVKLGPNALADKATVSRSQLYDVLGSKKGASIDFVAKLAKPLRVSVAKLLT